MQASKIDLAVTGIFLARNGGAGEIPAMGEAVVTLEAREIPACPWLPEVDRLHDCGITRRHGGEKGAAFYVDALRYSQSLWLAGKPAQAILQLNKAWMADLGRDEAVLLDHPPPYRALVWILRNAVERDHGFFGNPVRHFQHLASRMSGPRPEVRTWRAWLCMHLSEDVLDRARFPRDGEQIVREGLWIPGFQRAVNEVGERGWARECEELRWG